MGTCAHIFVIISTWVTHAQVVYASNNVSEVMDTFVTDVLVPVLCITMSVVVAILIMIGLYKHFLVIKNSVRMQEGTNKKKPEAQAQEETSTTAEQINCEHHTPISVDTEAIVALKETLGDQQTQSPDPAKIDDTFKNINRSMKDDENLQTDDIDEQNEGQRQQAGTDQSSTVPTYEDHPQSAPPAYGDYSQPAAPTAARGIDVSSLSEAEKKRRVLDLLEDVSIMSADHKKTIAFLLDYQFILQGATDKEVVPEANREEVVLSDISPTQAPDNHPSQEPNRETLDYQFPRSFIRYSPQNTSHFWPKIIHDKDADLFDMAYAYANATGEQIRLSHKSQALIIEADGTISLPDGRTAGSLQIQDLLQDKDFLCGITDALEREKGTMLVVIERCRIDRAIQKNNIPLSVKNALSLGLKKCGVTWYPVTNDESGIRISYYFLDSEKDLAEAKRSFYQHDLREVRDAVFLLRGNEPEKVTKIASYQCVEPISVVHPFDSNVPALISRARHYNQKTKKYEEMSAQDAVNKILKTPEMTILILDAMVKNPPEKWKSTNQIKKDVKEANPSGYLFAEICTKARVSKQVKVGKIEAVLKSDGLAFSVNGKVKTAAEVQRIIDGFSQSKCKQMIKELEDRSKDGFDRGDR